MILLDIKYLYFQLLKILDLYHKLCNLPPYKVSLFWLKNLEGRILYHLKIYIILSKFNYHTSHKSNQLFDTVYSSYLQKYKTHHLMQNQDKELFNFHIVKIFKLLNILNFNLIRQNHFLYIFLLVFILIWCMLITNLSL